MPLPPDRGHLKIEQSEAGVVVHLINCRALDELSTPSIEKELLELAHEVGPVHLLLDLDGVHYASSIALGMLVTLRQKLRTSGGRLTLVGVREEIYEVLDATRLTRLLEINRTTPAAE
jgi:anti-anti-sigma factor